MIGPEYTDSEVNLCALEYLKDCTGAFVRLPEQTKAEVLNLFFFFFFYSNNFKDNKKV